MSRKRLKHFTEERIHWFKCKRCKKKTNGKVEGTHSDYPQLTREEAKFLNGCCDACWSKTRPELAQDYVIRARKMLAIADSLLA